MLDRIMQSLGTLVPGDYGLVALFAMVFLLLLVSRKR